MWHLCLKLENRNSEIWYIWSPFKTFDRSRSMSMYAHTHTHKYIYIYICVCVCVWAPQWPPQLVRYGDENWMGYIHVLFVEYRVCFNLTFTVLIFVNEYAYAAFQRYIISTSQFVKMHCYWHWEYLRFTHYVSWLLLAGWHQDLTNQQALYWPTLYRILPCFCFNIFWHDHLPHNPIVLNPRDWPPTIYQ